MRYLVVVEQGPTSYGAYVPDLPGCVAAGETREEVLTLIREAIEFHLEGMKEDGQDDEAEMQFSSLSRQRPLALTRARRQNVSDHQHIEPFTVHFDPLRGQPP